MGFVFGEEGGFGMSLFFKSALICLIRPIRGAYNRWGLQ